MEIEKIKYRGYEYKILLNKGDWGKETNKFRVEGYGFLDVGYEKDVETIKNKTERCIDNWIDKKITNWYGELCDCMVWTGYEECELDKRMVEDVLEKFKKYILLENKS